MFKIISALIFSISTLSADASEPVSMTLFVDNYKGVSCYSDGCDGDKSGRFEVTMFRDSDGKGKLLIGGMEYERVPSPSDNSLVYMGLDANQEKGWAVMEIVIIDMKNSKFAVTGTRTNKLFDKPLYQMMGDISFE